jgi:hypothetical protein
MWRRVDLAWTDVSEERIASMFRVEKSTREEPAWAGGSRLIHQLKTPSYIRTYGGWEGGREEKWAAWEINRKESLHSPQLFADPLKLRIYIT